MSLIRINKWQVAIVTHEETTGPAHDLRDYLREKVSHLLFIAHPLLFIPKNFDKSSYWQFYEKGRMRQEGKAYHWRLPELALYVKDIIYTLIWLLKTGKTYDLYVGVGNLNAFSGLLLKKIGRVKRCAFYCIDYVPERFSNRIVNSLYHFIDRFVVESCDRTWNLSPRMVEGREKKWQRRFLKQITLPIGVWYNRIRPLSFEKINRKEILYMGTILEKQGIQLIIQALPEIKKTIPKIHFTIIGRGPYEEELKKLSKKLNLEKEITFMGYIKEPVEMETRMRKAAVAMAMYNKKTDMFSYYADPGKVKIYLAAGLPVLITDVPFIAQQVVDNKCGIIVEYNKDNLSKNIIKLLKDKKRLKKYRQNARVFAKQFDWEIIFRKALTDISLERG